jgi:hypothetical protein
MSKEMALKKSILSCIYSHSQLWELLEENNPILSKIEFINFKIQKQIISIEGEWNDTLKLKDTPLHVYCLYSAFSSLILNDEGKCNIVKEL